MKIVIFFFTGFVIVCGCVPEKRVVGVYGTAYGDTMRVIEDHSWRIELEEPDTVAQKQFKYTTGRWHKRGNKLELHVDSRSYGPYWECVPMKVHWRTLKRNLECDGSADNYVFRRVNYRKLRRVTEKEMKREKKRGKRKEDEKMKRKLEELEEGN